MLDHSPRTAVERLIHSAAHYVQPSHDLRPRTINAAREHCRDRQAEQKLGGLVLAIMLLLFMSSPALHYAELLRPQAVSPTASEMERLAIEYADRPDVGPHFGLSEAFTQLRQLQADRLGHTLR